MTQKKLRFALIGAGAGVYAMHQDALELDTIEICAVCDVNEASVQKIATERECPYYTDFRRLIDENKPDAVVIMTPHTVHKDMAIYAMSAGAHVLCEKPMAIHVQDADEMNATAEETGRILAVNFQQRLRPEVAAAYSLIQEGRIGRIQHIDAKIMWTRTALYYKMSTWRGTWNGEGGGLLMNQASHDLDLVCYLGGMPSRVYAWALTIAHRISTEDTVQAMLQWPGGALGSFHASTGEAGNVERIEIIGTKGILRIGKGSLYFGRFDTDLEIFIETSDQAFAAPGIVEEVVELPTTTGSHRDIYEDFCDAITNNRPPVAEGKTAVRGLELANAMIYSHYTNQAVGLPLDRQKYADLLTDLQSRYP
jgi:predicted dehydrogenase